MNPRTTRRPNLERVAAAAGVSRATVSRVVNGVATVAPELREKVERAIADLGYAPNLAARTLVTRRAGAVALVASEPSERVFADPFFGDVVRGVSQEAALADLQVVLLMPRSARDLERTGRYLRSAPVDGVLLISEHLRDDPLPGLLTRAGTPVVIGGRPLVAGTPIPFVDNDNRAGARLAVRHLLDLGRRRVGTLAGPPDMAAGIDRLAGYRDAVGATGDPDLTDPGLVEQGDFTTAGGERAAASLLARRPDLDALFAANDLMAAGALRALRAAGRRVPQDVAVVGFDDIEMAAMTDPPLTTVRQDTVLMGRTMMRMLMARIGLSPGTAPDLPDVGGDQVVLPVRLVVRASA